MAKGQKIITLSDFVLDTQITGFWVSFRKSVQRYDIVISSL